MYFSIVLTPVCHLFAVVPSGFEVNQPAEVGYIWLWLQNGYIVRKDVTDSVKCVECVEKKRTISAYYHAKLRSGTRV